MLLCQTFDRFVQSVLLQFNQLNEDLAIDSGGYIQTNNFGALKSVRGSQYMYIILVVPSNCEQRSLTNN